MMIPIELLQQKSHIFFYDSVILAQHDGPEGQSEISVKIRVMETFFLVLLRCYVVTPQGVLMRDVRWFHRFGDKFLLQDVEQRQASLGELENVRAMPKFCLPPSHSAYHSSQIKPSRSTRYLEPGLFLPGKERVQTAPRLSLHDSLDNSFRRNLLASVRPLTLVPLSGCGAHASSERVGGRPRQARPAVLLQPRADLGGAPAKGPR